MRVLVLTDVSSTFGDNCISTLCAIEDEMEKRNNKVIFAFHEDAAKREWTKRLKKLKKPFSSLGLFLDLSLF